MSTKPSIKKPSIKGRIVAGHAAVLQKYLADERPDEQTLARRFGPGELEILTSPIDPVMWYDIYLYKNLLEFLRDYVGGGDNEYLIQAGRRSAEGLISSGMYQQMEYLNRTQVSEKTDKHERHQAFGRDLRLLLTLGGSILNFLDSSVIQDPDYPNRWILQYKEAEDYPEVLCWTTQGFNNRMAEEHGHPGLWYWERPSPDVVLFKMNREA